MGKIILLNTPIGNIDDLTPRVFNSLQKGEFFAVEDTRSFKLLLNKLNLSVSGKKIYSLHDHSQDSSLDFFISLAQVNDLYVASEAGSPVISDPAFPLIVKAYEHQIEVDSYSGISSPLLALELSGLPPIPFHFHGFLPRESSKMMKIFKESPYGTNIFFESPQRIMKTLDELCQLDEDVDICVVRELSKKFQEVIKFRTHDWQNIKTTFVTKGEFVLLYYKSIQNELITSELKKMVEKTIQEGVTTKKLSKIFAQIMNKNPKDIYKELT